MKITPVGERVLILPDDLEQKTKNGIILKSIEDKKQDTGTVIAVGDGIERGRFAEGDKVIFELYGPREVLVGKVKHRIAHIDEILGVITNV